MAIKTSHNSTWLNSVLLFFNVTCKRDLQSLYNRLGQYGDSFFQRSHFFTMEPPFYCLFCRSVFKTVFFLKIQPILVVRVKIWPTSPPIIMTNGKIVKKVYFDSSKEASWCTERNARNPSSLQSMVSEKIMKNLQKLPFLIRIAQKGNFWRFFLIFSETVLCRELGFLDYENSKDMGE